MTWITDNTGTRWVDVTSKKKRRKSPRAVRFAALKVGDQLVLETVIRSYSGADWKTEHAEKRSTYYIVTDMWFDPVAGQRNEVAGRMVGILMIGADGEPRGRKSAQTLRGLASQGYQYADRDYVAWCKARVEAMKDGKVVGIGKGNVIRKRPKLPGVIF